MQVLTWWPDTEQEAKGALLRWVKACPYILHAHIADLKDMTHIEVCETSIHSNYISCDSSSSRARCLRSRDSSAAIERSWYFPSNTCTSSIVAVPCSTYLYQQLTYKR